MFKRIKTYEISNGKFKGRLKSWNSNIAIIHTEK